MTYLDGYLGGYLGLGETQSPSVASDTPSNNPAIIAEILLDGVWTDISAYLHMPSLQTKRGRPADLQRPGAGTATFQLLNLDGRFDRDNTDSPYYPNIKPKLPIRFRVKVPAGIGGFKMGASPLGAQDALAGTEKEDEFLFTGKCEGGPIGVGVASMVSWSASDAFKDLTQTDRTLAADIGIALSGEWINAVLDSSSPAWPEGLRDIDPGVRGVVIDPAQRTEHLSLLLSIAESEGGLFFIAGDGKAVFRDSIYAPAPHPLIYGDQPGEARYHDIEVADEDSLIINAVTVSAPGLEEETAEDAASQAENGRADISISTVLAGGGDMADLAARVITGYSQPRRRVSTLVLGTRVMDWRSILKMELWDRIRVRVRTEYGTTIEQVCRLEGIEHTVNGKNDWKVTWHLSSLPPVAASSNLLTENQSSMEINTDGWFVESSTNPGVVLTQATGAGRVYIGGQALGINTPPANVASVRSQPFDTAPVSFGQTYRATAYMAANEGAVFSVDIKWLDSLGATLSTTAGNSLVVNPAGPFRKVTVEGTAPIGASYAVVILNFTQPWPLSAGLAWADAVSLIHI